MVSGPFRSKLFGPLLEIAYHQLRIIQCLLPARDHRYREVEALVEDNSSADTDPRNGCRSWGECSQSVSHVSVIPSFVQTACCQVLIVRSSCVLCLLVRHIAVLEIIEEAGHPVLVMGPLRSRL